MEESEILGARDMRLGVGSQCQLRLGQSMSTKGSVLRLHEDQCLLVTIRQLECFLTGFMMPLLLLEMSQAEL